MADWSSHPPTVLRSEDRLPRTDDPSPQAGLSVPPRPFPRRPDVVAGARSAPEGRRGPGRAASGQVAGDGFPQEFHPHPGGLRGGHGPVGRAGALPLRRGHADRTRRAARRHRARPGALRGRHHDPHVRPGGGRATGPLGADPGHQRPHRPPAPVSAARRSHDHAGGVRAGVRRNSGRLDRGRKQHGQLLAERRVPSRLRAGAGVSPGPPPSTSPGRRGRPPRARMWSPPMCGLRWDRRARRMHAGTHFRAIP